MEGHQRRLPRTEDVEGQQDDDKGPVDTPGQDSAGPELVERKFLYKDIIILLTLRPRAA